MSDIEFPNGIIVKPPHEGAPSFIKCHISIKRKDLGNWLRGKTEDWINLDIKTSKNGKWYAAVNTWKPKDKEQEEPPEKPKDKDDFVDSEVPF